MALDSAGVRRAEPEPFLRGRGIFRNREKQLSAIRVELDRLRRDPGYFKVCEVVGLGGMGKSRLMDELQAGAKRARPRYDHMAFVSLETQPAMTEVGTLLSLRQELDVGCHLFDAALLRYWQAVGQPFSQDRSSRLSKSLVARTAETGSGFGPIRLPISFVADLWKELGRRGEERQRYEKGEFEEIVEMRAEPDAIRSRLPGYLALDLKYALQAEGHSIVIFYDSYEKQGMETRSAGAPWLQAFISDLNRGVHVIASREALEWDRERWKLDAIPPVEVGPLDEDHYREMIQTGLGRLASTAIVKQILDAPESTPLSIESRVNICIDRGREQGTIEVGDIPSSADDAVDSLLDHHRTPQRALAVALATVQVFDRELYEHFAHALSIELARLHYRDYLRSFLVEPLSAELHKTHDNLTDAVRDSAEDADLRALALEEATMHLLARCRENGRQEPQVVLGILRGVIAGWDSVGDMPERSVESLIDVAYLFYDAGFWNELASIAADAASVSQPSIAATVAFTEAVVTRRRSRVERAIEKFERIKPSSRRLLGRHDKSVELELAYLKELRGNYPSAREQFKLLSEQAKPFDPTDRTELRSRLYHGDMLTMDGHFREGSGVLEEAYEAVGYRDLVNWAELVRHDGHNYRFSFLFEKAADLYEEALGRTGEAPGMTAKLHTNLAETYCWFEPDLALEKGEVSLEAHRPTDNEIELCKCQAARAIALARLERFCEARDAIDEAKCLGESADYPAGVAFAIQAEAIAKGLARDRRGLGIAIGRLEKKVREIGTYGHLRVAPLLLRGDDAAFAAACAEYEWFDPERLEARLRGYLGA